MAILETFSKRQKRLSNEDKMDVYQYTALSAIGRCWQCFAKQFNARSNHFHTTKISGKLKNDAGLDFRPMFVWQSKKDFLSQEYRLGSKALIID
jgi:hypothetical protein